MIQEGTLPSMQPTCQEEEWREETHFMNLNEDPFLTGKIRHVLKRRHNVLGSDGRSGIEISGLGVGKEHCKIENNSGCITLIPNREHEK